MYTTRMKPGVRGEPHRIINISNHYIQKFADRLVDKPYGCQFLNGNAQNNGYVNWWYLYEENGEKRKRYITAHRFSALTSGLFTEKQVNEYCVLHHCDRHYDHGDISYRRCVNPDHLWIGDVAQNNADCVAKGRNTPVKLYGTDNHNSKLTEAQARYIIEHHYIITQNALAVKFNISKSSVEGIHCGRSWSHLER